MDWKTPFRLPLGLAHATPKQPPSAGIEHDPGLPGPAQAGAVDPENALDSLFTATRAYSGSREFLRLLRFMRKFPQYSPFNCFLLHIQNPGVSFVATAGRWMARFNRTIKARARPLVILAPMSPVLFVFDLEDTEGDPLPAGLESPFKTSGRLPGKILETTVENCLSLGIGVDAREFPRMKAGEVTMVEGPEEPRIQSRKGFKKLTVGVNQELDPGARYATLVHELAHIWCGHLGAPPKRPTLDRRNLDSTIQEFEAEAVSYIVCRRRGLRPSSTEYLAELMPRGTEIPPISLHNVLWAARKIEELGERLLPTAAKA